MKTNGNTILITGGATGIGFALAEAFVKAGNKVLICGRRNAKLEEAKGQLPQIQVFRYSSRTMILPKTGPMKYRMREMMGAGNCLARSLE